MHGYDKEYVVSFHEHVDSLKALLVHLEEIKDDYFPVKCKLYIFDSDTIKQKICMNKTHIALNGKTYANKDSIINYVNHLMLVYSPCNTERFIPDIIGADYIEGKANLYNLLVNKIDEIACSMNYKGTIILRLKCKADKNGNTTDAEISIVKPKRQNRKEKIIAKKIREYVIHNIFWNKDIDRGMYDIIYFSIRYSGKKRIIY